MSIELNMLKEELCSRCSRYINDLSCDTEKMVRCSNRGVIKAQKLFNKIRGIHNDEERPEYSDADWDHIIRER